MKDQGSALSRQSIPATTLAALRDRRGVLPAMLIARSTGFSGP